MATFKVEVKEVLNRIVEIEATTENEAIDAVIKIYETESIVLDADDFLCVEFNAA